MALTLDDYRWPLATIDFEASALGKGSYPIEMGISIWHGPGSRATTWSSLIRPASEWVATGIWAAQSQAIHGIRPADLTDAPTARDVLSEANLFAPLGTMLWCDGGAHDAYWLERLTTAAERPARFQLAHWARIAEAMDTGQRDRLHNHRAPDEKAHRAAIDAEDHVRAFAFALDVPEPDFVRIG